MEETISTNNKKKVVSDPLGLDSARFKIINPKYNLALDVGNGAQADNSIVKLWIPNNNINGGLNQAWTFKYQGNSLYSIVDGNSGKSLAVAGSSLVIQTFAGRPNQLWKVSLRSTGLYRIQNKLTGKTLSSPPTYGDVLFTSASKDLPSSRFNLNIF